ncbi:hypothetical protein LguiA_004354 [Lonicera macranthoides]
MEEEFSAFNHHHHRYVPHRPTLSPSDHRNPPYLRHHHHLPPPPPPPQLPLPLPPAPPPPPPYNPHQSQFTFLNPHPPLPHSPPPPRVSNRTLIDHNHHHYRNYPDPHPHPPRVSYRPTDNYIRDLDLEERSNNYRFRDGSVDGYRDSNLPNPQFLWHDRRRRGGVDDLDNFDQNIDSYRYDRRSNRYLSDSDRSRDFDTYNDSYNGPNSNVSHDFVAGFERNVEEPYVPMLDGEGFRRNRDDENRRWGRIDSPIGTERYDFEFSGEIVPYVSTRRAPNVHTLGKFNDRGKLGREEFIGTPKKQIQKKSALLRIGKPNHRNKSNDHFSKSPFDDSNTNTFKGKDKGPIVYPEHETEKDMMGSPVELDVSFKSNSLVAKAIMTPSSPVSVANRYLSPRKRMLRKADVANSPKTKLASLAVKLDRSTHGSDSPLSSDKVHKQSLEKVTDLTKTKLASLAVLDRSTHGSDSTASSDKIPKQSPEKVTDLPKTKLASLAVKLDRSIHGSDSPSSSVKVPKQSPEKVTVSGNVRLCDIGSSLPCSSGMNDSAGSRGVKGSPVGTVTEQVGNSGGSDGTPSSRVRKKKKFAPIASDVSSLQGTKEDWEPVKADTNSPSEADEAISCSKDQVSSVEIVMVHDDDASLPSLNEPTSDKMDECPQAVVSEKDYAGNDSGSPCVPNTGPSAPLEIQMNESTEKTNRSSVQALQFVSNSDEVLTELQNESTIADLDKVDDVSQKPCEIEVPLSPVNGIVNGSLDGIVPVGGTGIAGMSSPEEIQIHESPIDSHALVHDATNALSCDSEFIEREEDITVSGFDPADVGPMQSVDGTDALPEIGFLGGNSIPGSLNAEENKIHDGTTNADCSNHDSSTTSDSKSGPTDFQGNDTVSNDCIANDTNNQSCNDRSVLVLENGIVDESPNAKVLVGDEPDICFGQDTPTAKKKRKFRDTQLGLSSPSTSDPPVNVVSSIGDGEKALSYSVKDHVSTEEKVSGSGLVNTHIGLQTCNDGGSVLRGNISIEGSSEVDLSVSEGTKVNSPKNKKKRKVSANHEMPLSQDAPNPSLDNSKANTKSGQSMVNDISVNTTTKSIQSLNSTRGESSLRRNQPNSSVPKVFTGRSSLVFSRKIASTNAKPRTWHRADNPSVTIPPKKSDSSPVPPPKLSPKKMGKIQGGAYIRKGHSLVRKPPLSTTVSHGPSHTSSSSVYLLNPSVVGETKKSSGSETGGHNAPFERPKTPALPCGTKSLDCTTIDPAEITSLPLANPPANGGSETTSDSLENRENVDAPKSSEDAPRSSGVLGTDSTSMGSQSVLNEAGKIRYVKRKLNQLVAASSNGDPSVEDVDKTLAKSSDAYYKRRKNQLIRTPMETHITQGVLDPVDTSKTEGQWVPKFISSRCSSKKQFGKGSTKMYKHSKFSPVWRLGNTQLSRKDSNSLQRQKEATLAVAAVEKKKRERNGAARGIAGTKSRNHFSRARIYRIGAVRYKMDPTRRTLQRLSDEKQSSTASVQSEKDATKPYVPRRLVIGNDEYVRLGNGNQLIRDPKKRTRTLASEKVRWSLHTARLRLARKKKYCQFFTRFGKCNKDDGKCPYIHDPSKIAVCTKFLNGSCSNPNCKLTHKVIPERMQDCSYFLQGLCSNENCPYRHVNVNPNASVCEGFLKGYCADGNECRKKHTYVCPVFEATGTCSEGSKCKLHHPKTRTKSTKKKLSMDHNNTRGRYFGLTNIDVAEHRRIAGPKNHHPQYSKEDDIFFQEGKFADYVTLDVSDDEKAVGTRIEERTECNTTSSDCQGEGGCIDELIKPIGIMFKYLAMGSSPVIESASMSYVSEESNCCK